MPSKGRFSIVLFQPEIPGNTGSIGRTCVALGLRLILIKPYGFEIDEKAVRRAGLDYWKYVELTEYENWQEFLKQENPTDLHLFSRFASKTYFEAEFTKDCYLVFGRETSGLPLEITQKFTDRLLKLPTYSEHIRSLNLSNAATAVAYEALRQQVPPPFL